MHTTMEKTDLDLLLGENALDSGLHSLSSGLHSVLMKAIFVSPTKLSWFVACKCKAV